MLESLPIAEISLFDDVLFCAEVEEAALVAESPVKALLIAFISSEEVFGLSVSFHIYLPFLFLHVFDTQLRHYFYHIQHKHLWKYVYNY